MVDSSQFNLTRSIWPRILMITFMGKSNLKYVFGTILGDPNVFTSTYVIATILGAMHVLSRTIVICKLTIHMNLVPTEVSTCHYVNP